MGRESPFRKKKLPRVKELSNEPKEEDTWFTSPVVRLAAVSSGKMEEWSSLGSQSSNNRMWMVQSTSGSLQPTTVDEDDIDDEYEIEESFFEGLDDKDMNKLSKKPYILLSHGLRGAAELIRMLFVTVNEPYIDRKVLADELEAVLEETPYNTLPVITKGASTWGGAEALPRMLARKFCLLGHTNHEHLIVEAVFERLCRLKRNHAAVLQALPLEVKNKEKMEWITHQLRYVILPPAMAEWEKLILASRGPFIVACGMTLADIAITDFLDQCTAKISLDPLLADFDALADLLMLVKQNHRLMVYLEDRSDFDWNMT